MVFKTVCRFCLARNVRMHAIADSPLQGVYEKLTSTSVLNTSHWPVMACYICYSHLKKCHNLLVRSMRVDEVLTKIYQSGEVLIEESISMISHIQNELSNGLCCTPVTITAIENKDIEDNLIKTVKVESVQCAEEMDRSICVEYLKCEISENEPDMEADALEHIQDDESQELIENPKDELLEDTLKIEKDELTDLQHEGSGRAGGMNSMEPEGAMTTEKCKETREENKEYVIIEIPSMENVMGKQTGLEVETQRRTAGTHTSRRKKMGPQKRQNSTKTSMSPETSVNRGNDDTSTDLDVSSSRFLTNMYTCDMFDDKYLATERFKHHDVVKKTTKHAKGENLDQVATLHKQILSRTGIMNKHAETHSEKNPFDREICPQNNSQSINAGVKSKPFECEICKVRFTQKSSLNRHLRTHTGVKPFECEICKVRFNQKAQLQIHVRTHTGEKPVECEICKDRFIHKSKLQTHMIKHTGEKPFQCDICKVRFTQKGYIQRHLSIHNGEKPFECEVCKVRFNCKSNLNSHLRTHTGERPFKCEICSRRFSEKRKMKLHLRIHTGEKPFGCDVCNARYNNRDSLKIHLRTHTGEKPFQCDICGGRFSVQANLKVHLRTHTGEKPFECKICKVRFTQNSSLNQHLRSHTGISFECEICKARFSQKSNFNRHLRMHTGEQSSPSLE